MKEQEPRITKRKLIKTIVFGSAAIGIGWGVKKAVDYIDETFRPIYVNKGTSSMPVDPDMPFMRFTDWRRK